jgi:Spy/CpxP family protein refolding chaperone
MKTLLAALLFFAAPASAQDHAAQPYAGFQDRAIAGLSEDDIAQLRAGSGWGLALPAELNGKPGPAHLLELAEALELTPEQRAAIEAIRAEMQAEAIAAGERLIEAERALSDAFAGEGLAPERLAALIAASEAARAELRFVHLSRHLETVPLLTAQQIDRYNVLRGYAEDPCASVPEGHDPEMWRRHNRCG